MKRRSYLHLSRRERQIMDVLYKEGRASAARIRELLPDPPGYSTVRTLLRVLEDKGCVRHDSEGLQYVYFSTIPRDEARRSAISHVVDTFFAGSAEELVATVLARETLSRAELARLAGLIARARKEEK